MYESESLTEKCLKAPLSQVGSNPGYTGMMKQSSLSAKLFINTNLVCYGKLWTKENIATSQLQKMRVQTKSSWEQRRADNCTLFHLPVSPPSRKYCTAIITFPEGWRSTWTQSDTETVTHREPEVQLCRDRRRPRMSYPELSTPVCFLAALSKDRYSNSDLSQGLLCCFHQ